MSLSTEVDDVVVRVPRYGYGYCYRTLSSHWRDTEMMVPMESFLLCHSPFAQRLMQSFRSSIRGSNSLWES